MAQPLDPSIETTSLEDSTMRDVLETFAAPFFAIIDLVLAAPAAAALATASVAGLAVLAMLVGVP
jgi:hypothetical protein